MGTWQQTLRLIVRHNKTFSLRDREKNEFKLMEYFVDDTAIRKQIMAWLHYLDHNHSFNKKNIQKSEEFRKKGNKEFQIKKYISSIRYYTLSLQFAPWESDDLALAFANRSAALFYLDKFDACLKDIYLALECNYPKNMVYKLHLRAAHCYLKLNQKNLMKDALSKVYKSIENPSFLLGSKKESIEKQIDTLQFEALSMDNDYCDKNLVHKLPELAYDKNPNLENASSAVDLNFSIDKGRYLIANKDIKKGQILLVEKPFAFVLLDNNDSDTVCANCCKQKGDIPVPCKFCANTMYCTLECQKEAWLMYHQWECFGNQTGMWGQIGIAHLTVRTFLNCCFTEDRNKFNEVQRLITNIDKISTNDMFVYGVSALMMTLYLNKFTNFFNTINVYEKLFLKFDNKELNMNILSQFSPEEWSDDLTMLYVSGILLRNMLQLICNGHAITRINYSSSLSNNIITEYQCRIATAIYPSASMMNHSCDPNIINSFKDQYLIVKAIRDISANSEINNCYGPHYRRMRKEDRQLALQNQYCFLCKCEACTQKALQNFSDKFQKLRCKDCSGPVAIVSNLYIHCLDCEYTKKLDKSRLYELEEANKYYEIAQTLVKSEKVKEALVKAKQCLEIRKCQLYQHHEDITLAYDLIAQIFATMGHWQDALLYLDYCITAIEERFGSESIELANELNKITDICVKYLREETNTDSKQYKNILKKTKRYLNQAEEIFDLHYGPWNDSYIEITNKLNNLSPALSRLNL